MERKQKIQRIVSKSNSSFLKRVLNEKLCFDDDIRIMAYFELKNREETI